MISKERLEELIEQGSTIYELYMNKNILEIQLKNDWFVIDDGLYERKLSKHPFRSWWISNLYETKEDAEFVREFGCIERTERLELPTWEEFIEKEEVIFYSKSNQKTFISIIGTKYLVVERLFERYFTGELTKENYTIACRKAKELFLGENNG